MNTEGQQKKPQILVDDDWKSQAQAEKERLAEAEKETTQQQEAGGADGAQGKGPPPADFAALMGMLATQALMYLGTMADKKTGGVIFDPELSKFYIDLLGVIEIKTKGNLTEAEQKDLTSALTELRMRYVELSKMLEHQVTDGGPVAATGVAGTTGPMTG